MAMRWIGRKRVNRDLVLLLNFNIISDQNLDTDHTGGWRRRVTCLAVTKSASTSKRLRSWTSLIPWSQSPAGTGLWWRGSEWSGQSGQSESGDWGGELPAPLCGPLSRGEGETWHRDILTSWHTHDPQVQEMERDNNLRSLKKARKKCVGLCYILRQKILTR